MAIHTQTAKRGDRQWTMVDLYDLLMGEIEPDLMSAVIPKLAKLYAGETPGEARARAERYARAFATFDERLETVLTFWRKGLRRMQAQAVPGTARSGEEEGASGQLPAL